MKFFLYISIQRHLCIMSQVKEAVKTSDSNTNSKSTNSNKSSTQLNMAGYPFEKRLAVSQRIKTNYPDRIPIIILHNTKTQKIKLQSQKFVVPNSITMSKFIYELRSKIEGLSASSAIYLILEDGTIPSLASLIQTIYAKNQNADGFLYLTLCEENTFG